MSTTSEETETAVRALWVIGHRVTPLVVGGRVAALEVATPVGVPGPPPHLHEDCAELFYVTAGRLGVMVDGEWSSLGAGERAEVPRGTVHTFRNDGDEEVRADHRLRAGRLRGVLRGVRRRRDRGRRVRGVGQPGDDPARRRGLRTLRDGSRRSGVTRRCGDRRRRRSLHT